MSTLWTVWKRERIYFADPAMLFGIFWSSFSLFAFLQGWAEFQVGAYVAFLLEEWRAFAQWIADILTWPFDLRLGQPYTEAIALWIIIAGTTARAQQIKFKRHCDQIDAQRTAAADDPDILEITPTREDMEKKIRLPTWVCVPVNLVAWPLTLYAELSGTQSPISVLNPRQIWRNMRVGWFLSGQVAAGSRAIFALQWLYILCSLAVMFALNALDEFIGVPDLV